MNARPKLTRPDVAVTIAAAVLSALIAIGLLSAVTALFQRDGTPLGPIVTAEHACVHYAFVSEREICERLYVAASRVRHIASR